MAYPSPSDRLPDCTIVRQPLRSDGVGRALQSVFQPAEASIAPFALLLAAIDRATFSPTAG